MYKFMLNETSYHGAGAIKAVPEEIKARGFKKAFVASDPDLVKFGVTKKVTDLLDEAGIEFVLYSNIKPNPTIENVQTGVAAFKEAGADCIVAIGGGSSMDAAKVMWLMYENPEVNFDDIKQKFMDIRKRAFKFPELGKKAKMICIPTTSGTGSEVTPFAVITDKKENKKYPLTDYALTPTIAIVDPEFVMSLPIAIAAAAGQPTSTVVSDKWNLSAIS